MAGSQGFDALDRILMVKSAATPIGLVNKPGSQFEPRSCNFLRCFRASNPFPMSIRVPGKIKYIVDIQFGVSMVNSMFSVCRTMKDLGAFLWISIRNQCWKFNVNVDNLYYFPLDPNQT